MSEGLFQQRPTDPPQGEAAAAALGWVPLLEDLPLGLLLVDAAGNPVALNAAACRLLATDRETLVALDARAFLDRLVTSTGTRLATQGIAALAGQEPGATMRLGWVPATAGIAWLDLSAKTLQGGGVLLSLKEAPLDPGQDLFAKVFRACPDGITISSMEDGTYLEVNEVMLNQMGMSRDQVVGHSSLELDVWVNPEDRLRYLEELSRTGSVRNFETRFRTRAGRILPFEVSSEIIQVQGKPYSFNFMRDLTTARELVKGRQESEAKFRLLFEQAPLGMAVVETETGHFRSVNHRLGTIIGCEAASLIGRSFQEFTHPDDLAADVRSVQDLAIGNVKEVEKEKRYINGLGKVVWGRLKMVKLPPAPDGTARHLSLVEDITAHKVLGLRLSKSNLPDLSKSEARQGGF